MPVEYANTVAKPIPGRWVVLSLVLSYVAEWFIGDYPRWTPDFVLVFLCCWGLHYPESFNIVKVFLLAVLMDVVSMSPLGQHVFGYTMVAYVLISQQQRLVMLPIWQQALVIGGLHILHYLLIACVRWLLGGMSQFPDLRYWLPALSGTCVWIVASWSVRAWQQGR